MSKSKTTKPARTVKPTKATKTKVAQKPKATKTPKVVQKPKATKTPKAVQKPKVVKTPKANERMYNSKEICAMFNITAPRLLQFRKGQLVNVKSKDGSPRTYTFDPILIENKDWYWNESEAVFRESAITKIKERKANRKLGEHTANSKAKRKEILKTNNSLKDGEYLVPAIAKKYKITVQNVYSLRDTSTTKPKSYSNYLIQGKDWRFDGGKVILLKSSIAKIEEYVKMLKEKRNVPKANRISVLVNSKLFHLSGEDAKKVIEMLQKKQNDKNKYEDA